AGTAGAADAAVHGGILHAASSRVAIAHANVADALFRWVLGAIDSPRPPLAPREVPLAFGGPSVPVDPNEPRSFSLVVSFHASWGLSDCSTSRGDVSAQVDGGALVATEAPGDLFRS